ncbi:MAG: hypothetical protein EFT35_07725 [Methanophagales archaeon ANME-1-THS]|nr:MAG: hypothetical protein EFT35_07725 [Methanophagales archaeon ANME-1-THS]
MVEEREILLEEKIRTIMKRVLEEAQRLEAKKEKKKSYKCPACGGLIEERAIECQNCGESLEWEEHDD